MQIFALSAAQDFGMAIAGHLGIGLSPLEERGFEDGEHKARPLVSVRGQDVYVVERLNGDAGESVNDLTDDQALDELCGNAALNGIPVVVAPAGRETGQALA